MKVGFVFSGYGTQWIGMGKDLYDHYRCVQEVFEEAANCLDTNFVKLAFASSDAELKKIEHAYLVLLVVMVSTARVLKEHGITPVLVAGDDVGEYAAVVTAGALSFPDALYLAKKFATLYQTFLDTHHVAALRIKGMEKDLVQQLCDEGTRGAESASIAVAFSPKDFLVTGTQKAIQYVSESAHTFSYAKVKEASVGGGLHSPLLGEFLKTMRSYLEKVDFKDTQTPFVTGVIGEPLMTGETIRAALMQHICAPTAWEKVQDGLSECDVIIEVGPGSDIKTMFAERYPDKRVFAVGSLKDIKRVVPLLTGVIVPDTDPDEAIDNDHKGLKND